MSINRDLKNSTTSLLRSRGSIRIGICSWRVTRLLLLRIRWWVSGILWGVALGRWCWPLGVIPRSGARLLVGRVHHRLWVGRIHPWLLVCRYWCYLLWWRRVLKNIQFINYLQIKMQALTFITIQKKIHYHRWHDVQNSITLKYSINDYWSLEILYNAKENN